MAAPGEFSGAGESGGAGTDDGYFVSRGGCALHQRLALRRVHGVALQPTDADGFVLAAQHASAFAELLHRADPGTSGTQQIGLQDGAGRAHQVTGSNLLDEARDVDMRGAGVRTRSVVTEEAAVSFDGCFVRTEGRELFVQAFHRVPFISRAYDAAETPKPTNQA